jgi:hypothetical protein
MTLVIHDDGMDQVALGLPGLSFRLATLAGSTEPTRSGGPSAVIWRYPMLRQPKKSIKVALQGGGSHGAFT